jgi:ubiquinone biosynthesis monooxygenase Coq7
MSRQYSFLDRCLGILDNTLRTLASSSQISPSNPVKGIKETSLSSSDKRKSAGLMRVNHAGEVSAQALYQGQALTARSAEIRERMQRCAEEEMDHLAWTQDRLSELHSHVSYLNPFWYLGSFTIGLLAGVLGDKWSLGFIVETEKQVVEHLIKHLHELPVSDHKSRAVIEQMRWDEAKHANVALEAGASELPPPVKLLMRLMSKVMTTTAYWV